MYIIIPRSKFFTYRLVYIDAVYSLVTGYVGILLCSPKNVGGAYSRRLVRPSVRQSVRPIHVRPITSLFEVGFRNYFTDLTTRRRVTRNIWVATLKFNVTA